MAATIAISDRPERRAAIDAQKVGSTRTDSVPYRGQPTEFPIVRLPVDLPIYRMDNGRTLVEQYEWVADNALPEDFFTSGEETISAQRAQHSILVKMSKDPKANIYGELARVATQHKNLLITADGVVLNGNRRLAAMRELFAEDPQRYSSFSHINVMVLPPEALVDDLELIEAELQLAPEMKLGYGWIERRLKLRRHVEVLGISEAKIKETYRFRRSEEINVELQQLNLAEEYLETYLGRPKAYKEVERSFQLFKDLQKALTGKSGSDADLRRIVGFALAKEARKVGDRVYRYNAIFGTQFDRVMGRLAEEREVAAPDSAVTEGGVENDPLAGLPPAAGTIYEAIQPLVNSPDQSSQVVEELARIHTDLKEEDAEEDQRTVALTHAQDALRTLSEIDISATDPDLFAQILGQLDGIAQRVAELRATMATEGSP